MGIDHQTVVIFPDYLDDEPEYGGSLLPKVRALAMQHAEAAEAARAYGAPALLYMIGQCLGPQGPAGGRPVLSTGKRVGGGVRMMLTDEYEGAIPPLMPFLFDVLTLANHRSGSEYGVYDQIRVTLIHSDDGGDEHPPRSMAEVYLKRDHGNGTSFLCTDWLLGGDDDSEDQKRWERVPVEKLFAYSMLVVDGKLAPDKFLTAT